MFACLNVAKAFRVTCGEGVSCMDSRWYDVVRLYSSYQSRPSQRGGRHSKCVLAKTLQKTKRQILFGLSAVTNDAHQQAQQDSIVVVDNARAVLVRLGDTISLSKVVLLTLAVGVKHRTLSLAAHAYSVAAVRRKSVGGRVVGDTVIPERDITRLPLESCMELWAGRYNLIQQRDNVITLSLRHTNDLGHKARVEEDALPAGDRVCAYERVLGCDRFAAHGAAEFAGALGLQFGRVQRCKGLKVLLHGGAEHVVGGVLRGPESIATAATWWASEDLERSVGGRLELVGDLLRVSVWCWRFVGACLHQNARGR